MQVHEHITTEAIERYAARASEPTEMLAVQRHAASCEMCREKLTRTFDAENAFAGLRNNFALDDSADDFEHLPYEQLALFVDGKMDDVDREIAESHLAICAECERDLADLSIYQKIADAPPVEKNVRQSIWQRLFAFDSFGAFVPAAGAAVILLAILAGAWFLLRSNRNQEIAETNVNKISPLPTASTVNVNSANNQSVNSSNDANAAANQSPQTETIPNAAPEYALNDGQMTIDADGNARGLETLSPSAQRAVRQSIQSGKVSVGANSLGANGGVLMGGGSESDGVPFALRTPVGKVVVETQPTLRWKPLAGATAYSVAVVDQNFRVVAESGKLTATEWRPAKSLPRGATYSWQVTATKADGTETVSPSSPAPQAKFKVLDAATASDINKLQQTKSHLALGVLYAQNNLIQEARREFETLLRENPKSALARKLLQSVKGKSK